MKKLPVLLTVFAIVFACGCDAKIDKSPDNSTAVNIADIKFDYPDQIKYVEGGTCTLTVFKCGVCFYACEDGRQEWAELYSAPLEMEEGEFVRIDAEYDLAYGGVAGYRGNKRVKKINDEKSLTFDDVVDMRIISLYDKTESTFSGLRLIKQDNKNYLLCRDPLLKYRLYDDKMNLLCTYDTSMACAAVLDDDADNTIEYGSRTSLPFYVMRMGDVYYAYSGHYGFNKWTPLLDMNFENKPLGFELKDGGTIKISNAKIYKINGGKENYVNAPMFEEAENFEDVNYSVINEKASVCRWEQCTSYENGDLYRYMFSGEEYLIFYLDGRFHVYYEKGCDPATDAYLGVFDKPEDVDALIGRV